jgi:hypothetical protein
MKHTKIRWLNIDEFNIVADKLNLNSSVLDELTLWTKSMNLMK